MRTIHNPAFVFEPEHEVVAKFTAPLDFSDHDDTVGYGLVNRPGHNTLLQFEDFVRYELGGNEQWCKYCNERTADVRVQAYHFHQETTGCDLPFRGWDWNPVRPV